MFSVLCAQVWRSGIERVLFLNVQMDGVISSVRHRKQGLMDMAVTLQQHALEAVQIMLPTLQKVRWRGLDAGGAAASPGSFAGYAAHPAEGAPEEEGFDLTCGRG